MGGAKSHQLTRKLKSMEIVTGGIDLAKYVFALHGVDEGGRPALVRFPFAPSPTGPGRFLGRPRQTALGAQRGDERAQCAHIAPRVRRLICGALFERSARRRRARSELRRTRPQGRLPWRSRSAAEAGPV